MEDCCELLYFECNGTPFKRYFVRHNNKTKQCADTFIYCFCFHLVCLTPRFMTSVDFLTRCGHKPPTTICNHSEAAIMNFQFLVIFIIACSV